MKVIKPNSGGVRSHQFLCVEGYHFLALYLPCLCMASVGLSRTLIQMRIMDPRGNESQLLAHPQMSSK
jgi:hypothetical protein